MIYKQIYLPDDVRNEAIDFTKSVIDLLDDQHRLSGYDAASFYILTDSFSQYLDGRDIVNAEGLIVTTSMGNKAAHPAFTIAKECNKTVMNIAKEMGLSLRSRKMITNLAQETESSPLELFLKQNLSDD